MRKVLKKILLAGTLLGLGIAHGQVAKEQSLSPDSVIRLEIKFDGPDASKITTIYGGMGTNAQRPPDQAGFLNNFPGTATLVSPGIFRMEFTVPKTAVTGDYTLSSLDVRAPGIQIVYNNGEQFHLHTFHIENHNKFTQPSITVNEIH
jgi:hypothetical protein